MYALRWHDFDFDRREVRIRRAASTDFDGSLLENDVKMHASRRLALDEGAVGLLRQHRLRQREKALALGVPWPTTRCYLRAIRHGIEDDDREYARP